MIDSGQSLSVRSGESQSSPPTIDVDKQVAILLIALRPALIMLLGAVEDALGYQRSIPTRKQRTGRI